MMRSMYSGVSGLRAHQIKMDVIGNNIANVNTVGYKRGQVTFQEVFSQVVRGAGAPQGGKGGTNPQQVGLGLKIGSINTIHTKGATQRTENPTDLMIDGDGYFMVTDDVEFENKYFTRAGNFDLDRDGYLVTGDGFKVLGLNENGDLAPIRINRTETAPPTASTTINFKGNIDSRLPIDDPVNDKDGTFKTDTTIKDSLGNSFKVNFEFVKTADNEWDLKVTSVKDLATGNDINVTGTPPKLIFNSEGKLTTDPANFELDFSGASLPSSFGSNGSNKITINFGDITQFANEGDATGKDAPDGNGQYGKSSGSLDGFSIDAAGVITGSFTNGTTKTLGQIALAKFDNPSGLQKIGNNFFQSSPNSGVAQVGKPGTSGFGAMNPGTLEMSNVDLSLEFTEMITTQRGFQANSRIITTSDEMLQELVNMKR